MSNTKIDLIPANIANQLPAQIRREVNHFSASDQDRFVEKFKRKSASIGTALLFWLFLMHWLYLKKYRAFIFFIMLLSFVMYAIGFNLLRTATRINETMRLPELTFVDENIMNQIAVGVGVFLILWWIIDLVRIPGIIRQRNAEIATNLFRKVVAEKEQAVATPPLREPPVFAEESPASSQSEAQSQPQPQASSTPTEWPSSDELRIDPDFDSGDFPKT